MTTEPDLFRIKKAQTDDLDTLMALYGHLHPDEPVNNGPTLARKWAEIEAHPGLTVFLGVMNDVAIATCTLVVVPNLTRRFAPYALIENVVTHTDFRQRGYGQKVLSTAIDDAWATGCYKVMLLTGATEPATLSFYRRAGFETTKTGFQIRAPGFRKPKARPDQA